MQSCAPNLLTQLPTDSSAYYALVTDACEFNRGLRRNRAARLPFLDMATQTTQKPAPWLYRTICERSQARTGSLYAGTHVFLRYLRQRWYINQPTPAKKRKRAADRLWCTLQTGLNALGIPTELIPLVTKRAYAIAGLPIPASAAPQLEAWITKTNNNTPIVTAPCAINPNRLSAVAPVARKGLSHELWKSNTCVRDDVDSNLDEIQLDDHETRQRPQQQQQQPHANTPGKLRGTDLATVNTSGEDSMQSGDICGPKRCASDEVATSTFDNRTDDEVSLQSANGAKIVNSVKAYDLDDDSEDAEDAEEENEDDDEEDFDEDELDDDVEWVQPRGRRSYSTFTAGRSSFRSRRRQQHRTVHPRKASGFSVTTTRLADRRIIKSRHSQGHCAIEKSRATRCSDVTDPTTTNTLVLRRGARLATSVKTKVPSVSVRMSKEKYNAADAWNAFPEPGFQPNSSLLSAADKSLEDTGGRPSSHADSTRSMLSHSVSSYASAPSSIANSEDAMMQHDPVKTCPTVTSQSSVDVPLDVRRPMPMSDSNPMSSTMTPVYPTASAQSNMGSLFGTTSLSRPTMTQLLAASNLTPTADTSAVTAVHASAQFDYHSNMTPDTMTVGEPSDPMSSARTAAPSPIVHSNKPSGFKDTAAVPVHETPICRGPEYSGNNRFVSNRPCTNTDAFATPQGATTTVTFFVCEVCASRYRSTAGLRYHYHSQHSGYTPKNPISASASRLVVPVGEERGIGGGLRGGRPRRHKVSNVDGRIGRGRTKEFDINKNPSRLGLPEVVVGSSPVTSAMDGMDKFRDMMRIQQTSGSVSSTETHIPTSAYMSMNSATLDRQNRPMGDVNVSLRSARSLMRGANADYCPPGSTNEPNEVKPNDRSGSYVTSDTDDLPGSVINTLPTSGSHGMLERLQTLQPMPNSEITSSSSMASFRPVPSMSSAGPTYATQLNWAPQDTYTMTTHQAYSQYRMSPSQRRFERQRCPDRTNPHHHHHHPPPSIACIPNCVYCLSDDRLNPRIGHPEGLLRCSRCGNWAHFSCLHLPAHVIETAMRYPWQCIECKSCWLCGSSEYENRMIFCGECDRVFHIDCLPNPLPRPLPTVHWTCDICLHELYAVADNTSVSAATGGGGADGQVIGKISGASMVPHEDNSFYTPLSTHQ